MSSWIQQTKRAER